MRIILCAFDDALKNAWDAAVAKFFHVFQEAGHVVETTRGDITKLAVTAVVSPANSYGFMRGGVDLAYALRFGPSLEENVRKAIAASPQKLLSVGEALCIDTGDENIPYLISAPTMVRPMRLADAQPIVAASRAATLCALRNGYDSVAFPGMGTGTGGAASGEAARAMTQGIVSAIRIAGE